MATIFVGRGVFWETEFLVDDDLTQLLPLHYSVVFKALFCVFIVLFIPLYILSCVLCTVMCCNMILDKRHFTPV